jgi:hypothetical protein
MPRPVTLTTVRLPCVVTSGEIDRRAAGAVDQRAALHHNGLGVSGESNKSCNGKNSCCKSGTVPFTPFVAAKAGTQCGKSQDSSHWPSVPAFAGTNGGCGLI